MRIYSWNVNGLRANIKKGTFEDFLNCEHPDILCMQEIKAKPGQATVDLPNYLELWNSAERPGYSGTAVFSKFQPLNSFSGFLPKIAVNYDWTNDQHGDVTTEGRIQTVEFQLFYLVNVYVPNSKPSLERLSLREKMWDPALLQHLKALEAKKPVIVCGDFNAAHTEIDLARPKDNEGNAGFTKEERQGVTNLIDAGFVDTFRHFHPDEQKYTWWTFRANARVRNIGWRIDYFFVSPSLLPHLKNAEIHDDIMGSDHCPISIELEF